MAGIVAIAVWVLRIFTKSNPSKAGQGAVWDGFELMILRKSSL